MTKKEKQARADFSDFLKKHDLKVEYLCDEGTYLLGAGIKIKITQSNGVLFYSSHKKMRYSPDTNRMEAL